MNRIYSTVREVKFARYLLAAVLPGISLGIFLHGYWLIDLFAIDSKRLLLSTVLTCLLGIAGYAFLFYLTGKGLAGVSKGQLAGLLIASMVSGAFLFFAGSDRWQAPTRYFSPLLPRQSLQISMPAGQESESVSVAWFTTSLGDISFDTMQYTGWKRESDRLVLSDLANNNLSWSGKTGEKAQIIFESPARSGDIIIAWNGQAEVFSLSAQKFTTLHSFDIPFFASREFILLLGTLNFILLSFPLCLLVWKKRSDMLRSLQDSSMAGIPQRLEAWEWAILAGVILLASLLRLPNLENLYPGVDEYYQLIAAKQITQGVPMGEVYQRSLWLVTLPAALMFRLFGYELWAARLPGAVMNAFAVLPLYFVARKINRPVAVLSILLYATSPWMIAFGRIVREYAYYPFLFYWVVYGMILFLEEIPHGFRLDRDMRIFLQPKMLLLILGFAILPMYAYIDITSTFKLILIAHVILGIFIFGRMDWGNKINQLVILLVAGGIVAGAFYWLNRFSVSWGFGPAPLQYFFQNPPQQWYFERVAFLPLAGLLGVVVIGFLIRRTNVVPLFMLTLFAGFLSFFILSSNKFNGTRHLSTTNLWYVVLLATGFYLICIFLRSFSLLQKKQWAFPTLVALVLLIFNFNQPLLAILSSDPAMPISEDYHHEMGLVHEFMLANAQENDVLIASIYGLHAEWQGAPAFREIYRFSIQLTGEQVLHLVDQNDSGWIVIDEIRTEAAAFPVFETFSRDGRIDYVGKFGDELVWRWSVQ